MNEHEISFHVNNNSRLQSVQPDLSLQLKNIKCRSSQQKCSIKKAALKNLAIFTGKHLRWSLFLIKLQALNTYFEKYLRTAA